MTEQQCLGGAIFVVYLELGYLLVLAAVVLGRLYANKSVPSPMWIVPAGVGLIAMAIFMGRAGIPFSVFEGVGP